MPQNDAYRYSYSGADAKVYAMINRKPETLHLLESIHTLSVSVHESKGQARALGYRGIKGLSRGQRTIAGTLIFTVIEDHPLKELMVQSSLYRRTGWSVDRDMNGTGSMFDEFSSTHMLSTLLEPFDLMVQYVSEVSQTQLGVDKVEGGGIGPVLDYEGAGMLISNIDIVDMGIVTSVNDIVSEITMSFIAQDFKPITLSLLRREYDSIIPHDGVDRARINPQVSANEQHAELERFLNPDRPRIRPGDRQPVESYELDEYETHFDDSFLDNN